MGKKYSVSEETQSYIDLLSIRTGMSNGDVIARALAWYKDSLDIIDNGGEVIEKRKRFGRKSQYFQLDFKSFCRPE